MEINPYVIELATAVIKTDIPHLDKQWRLEIRDAIRAKLTSRPDLYGKPLHQSLKGFRKLRVGDYRVIFQIQKKTVKILAIGHRSIIYPIAIRRIS